jgi:phosphoribosylaminoimidazole-succinocarboxamide synthase
LPDNVDPITTEVLAGVDLPFLGTRRRGKVRDLYELGDRLIMVATDRLSAFDRILGLVPHKGQVLTQLAAFWFQHTRDLVGNALLEVPDPNVTVARLCRPLAVEVVVRGFITGVTSTSLWRRYSLGDREIYGIRFPDGLSKNDALSEPIITPTTKAADGSHDERITAAQVVKQGIATSEQWDAIARAAVAVFRRGQEIAARGGLILVDTKYEFGVTPEGEVVLIDEIHTPDSSRFWVADTMQARILSGHEPENFDKEFVRLYYAERGYRGEGEPFALPNALADEASRRYIAAYERITGASFVPAEQPANARIERSLREWLSRHEGTGS